MTEKLIFSQTFEGLFRATRALLEEEPLRAAVRAAGVDLGRPLRPAYPLSTFQAVVKVLGSHLTPLAPAKEQVRLVGHRFIHGYEHTVVGRAMLMVMRLLGPARTLERLSRQFRTGNNFSETRLRRLSPHSAELWCNQVSMPGWYEGLIEGGLAAAGAKNVRVTAGPLDEHGGTFTVTWEP